MILKDFYCPTCGASQEDVAVDSCNVCSGTCACGGKTEAVANGGTGRRTWFMDDNPEAHRDVQILSTTATYGSTTGEPAINKATGRPYHERHRYTDEGRAERREQLLAQRRIDRAGPRLFLDGKRGVTSAPGRH